MVLGTTHAVASSFTSHGKRHIERPICRHTVLICMHRLRSNSAYLYRAASSLGDLKQRQRIHSKTQESQV